MTASTSALQAETVEVCQKLIRFNTVNPPGNEAEAIDFLDAYLSGAGFETVQLSAEPGRPNLIATLKGKAPGPTLGYLGHVDTVLAEPADWEHDPWAGEIADGYLWGRGAIDMKSQVAAEAVAAASLARAGWRPTHGTLKLIFVCDEEVGGYKGARWLTLEHPDQVRCDYLINEGTGAQFELSNQRYYGVCCGEKGIYRFELGADGVAGHGSIPQLGDNALLKLAGALTALKAGSTGYDPTEPALALLDALHLDRDDVPGALEQIAAVNPKLPILIEPMFRVTMAPTMISASEKVNVIPAHASLKVDCRVPPGHGIETAETRLHELLGDELDMLTVTFTEQQPGFYSTPRSPLMAATKELIGVMDPGAKTVPTLMPAYSDSNHFRTAFPDIVAYGFFPQRHQNMVEATAMMHNSNERIDVRDLGFAADFYAGLAGKLLG